MRVPMYPKQYFVYILTNKSNTLYIGVTNNLVRRLYEHKHKLIQGFTAKYNLSKLLYFEIFDDPQHAIAREKQFKGLTRAKKLAIVKITNPSFKDLTKIVTGEL